MLNTLDNGGQAAYAKPARTPMALRGFTLCGFAA
jgi:hypothetical protein